MMRSYKPRPGEHYEHAAQEMIRLADESGETVTCHFNGLPLTAAPGMTVAAITRAYATECERRRREREASPEYAREEAAIEARWEDKKRALAAALKACPAEPALVSRAAWDAWLAAQGEDDYGRATFRYAWNWARLMESRMTGVDPQSVAECADEASHLADDEGFTGAMVGMAREILVQTWIHGEALRHWHEGQRKNREEAAAAGGEETP